MKNKKIFLNAFLVLAMVTIVITSKNFGSSVTANYCYNANLEKYNQHLSASINSMQQLQKSLKEKKDFNLYSVHMQLSECISNLRETSVAIDFFEIGLNAKSEKMVYGLNPIESQLVKSSTILLNHTNLDDLIIDTDKIIKDLKIIQDANIFSENQYEKIQIKWNIVIEELNIKPESGL